MPYFIRRFFDIVIPRWVGEDYFVEYDERNNTLKPLFPVAYYVENKDTDVELKSFTPQYVSGVTCFNLFGFGLFAKVSEPMKWTTYLRVFVNNEHK